MDGRGEKEGQKEERGGRIPDRLPERRRRRGPGDFRLFAGIAVLSVFIIGALFADFLAPYDPAAQDRERFHAPPTGIHFVDERGEWRWRPVVYRSELVDGARRIYREDRARAFPLEFFVAGEPYRFLGLLECRVRLFGVEAPARIFLLGSDGLGRDVFSRLLHGARVSLSIAAASLLISFPLALVVGSLAGYYSGPVDFLLMRLVELFLALPAFYLIIALRSALPLDLAPGWGVVAIIAVITLFGWASLARVVRGIVLSLRERDYIVAAHSIGATDARIIGRHILPQLSGLVLVQAALAAPGYILAEVTLSYLGLGIQEPVPSWGNMLSAGGSVTALVGHWWLLAPGAALLCVSLGFQLLAEGLRSRLDPRARAIGWVN